MTIKAVPAVKQPQLFQLGLIGFSREQEAEMKRTLLATESSEAVWRVGPLQASAAWCVHGARTQVLLDGSIRVAPGQAGGRPVRLSLAEVDSPVAFAEPVACKELEPAITLRPADAECVMATLRKVESRWLGTTVARNWLAARLVACEGMLKHRVYHVLSDGELLAVVDRGGDVGIAPGAGPSLFETSRWVGLPSSASFIPADFHPGDSASCTSPGASRCPPGAQTRHSARRPPGMAGATPPASGPGAAPAIHAIADR